MNFQSVYTAVYFHTQFLNWFDTHKINLLYNIIYFVPNTRKVNPLNTNTQKRHVRSSGSTLAGNRGFRRVRLIGRTDPTNRLINNGPGKRETSLRCGDMLRMYTIVVCTLEVGATFGRGAVKSRKSSAGSMGGEKVGFSIHNVLFDHIPMFDWMCCIIHFWRMYYRSICYTKKSIVIIVDYNIQNKFILFTVKRK